MSKESENHTQSNCMVYIYLDFFFFLKFNTTECKWQFNDICVVSLAMLLKVQKPSFVNTLKMSE